MPHNSTITKIILPIGSLLLFLFLGEIVLRVLAIDTFFENRFFLVNRALDYPDLFKKDRDLFWRFRPDQTISSKFFEGREYRINSLGLRGEETAEKTEKIRIAGLGNSCTFGWGVTDSETYLNQLKRMIDADENLKPIESVNAGIPGYSSLQGKRFLEREILATNPDILMIMFAWNDQWAASDNIADKNQEFPPQLIIDLQNILSQLELYRLMKRAILSVTEVPLDEKLAKSDIVYRVSFDDYYENIQYIVNTLCAKNNVVPILLTSPIPSLEMYYPPGKKSPMHRYHQRYNDLIRQIGSESGIHMVDLAQEFDKYNDLFDDARTDPIHFNAKGHQVAARTIYDYYRNNIHSP